MSEVPGNPEAAREHVLEHYAQACRRLPQPRAPLERLDFVAFDTETTGTDPRRDGVVSIGAIGMHGGQIHLGNVFETLVKFNYNTASVVVHGVTQEEAEARGISEEAALLGFLDYIGGAVLVGHHVGFDLEIISRGCEKHFGTRLCNPAVDTMALTLNLERDGALPPTGDGPPDYSLEGLCQRFRIIPRDRHTASGDAFITAQIFLRLQRLARRYNRNSLQAISEPPPEPEG